MEELLDGVYMTPTYGNTLMGLAASSPSGPHDNYKITYYAPQPRAVIEVVDFDDPTKLVEYGQTGRVKLTTLTKEFFMPGFLERDEGEREPPCEQVSVGRRQRRAAVPRAGRHDDGRRLLMHAESSRSALGPAVHEPGGGQGRPLLTGETLAKVSQANGGLLGRDMRQAQRAREVLREIPIAELIERRRRPANST